MKAVWLLLLGALCFAIIHAPEAEATTFTPCKDTSTFLELHGSLCATFQAPLRAPGPRIGNAAKVTNLFVREFPASGKAKGVVWLVYGGPGGSGALLYPFLKTLRAAFPGFDLLIPDPRGTGFSTRLCPKQESVDSPGGMALVGAEWNACWASLNAAPDYARAFSLTNAAYDLADLIAQHHSHLPTYVYGVSYGTQVVPRMLTIQKENLAGAILDSLVPPDATTRFDLSHRSQIVNAVGTKVLAQCDANPSCKRQFATTAVVAYEKLLTSSPPGVLAQIPDKNIKQFFGHLLNYPTLRARIPELIAELGRGDTTDLQAVKASLARTDAVFGKYPQSPPSIPLAAIITDSSNDARPRLTMAELKQEQRNLLFTSPLPGLIVAGLLPHPSLPLYPHDKFFNAPPIFVPKTLVLQGTLDPFTPLQGANERIASWHAGTRVRLVTVAGAPHFILMNTPTCFVDAVHQFLAGEKAPLPACKRPNF
ncbi:MAG: alpha/beta hydrolase [Rhodanobacteraceae bacterium]